MATITDDDGNEMVGNLRSDHRPLTQQQPGIVFDLKVGNNVIHRQGSTIISNGELSDEVYNYLVRNGDIEKPQGA